MIKNYLFLGAALFILAIGPAMAQEEDNKELANTYLELAEQIYQEQGAAIEIARDYFVQAADLDPDNIRANFMAGRLYLETVNKDRSSRYLERVHQLDPNYRYDITYLIARGYHLGMDFDNALRYYRQYETKTLNDKNYRGQDKVLLSDVQRRIAECENGKEFMANPAHYSIVNLGSEINSEWRDYAPVLNEDETIMIFTSRRKEGNLNENVDVDNIPFEDIFISKKVDGKWSRAENIGNVINTPSHDSNLALSADGQQLYIYSDENEGDILVSEQKNGAWSPPVPLGDAINSSFMENSVSISPDRQLLFFASNRPGGYGGIDIYVSEKDRRGNWGKSRNLGPVINTEFDEEGPFIDYDGKTLYFSSMGHKGMGGHDIFKSEYDSVAEEWTTPVNLGYPINTPDNDIYFVSTKDGKRGYYASVRTDGMGYTDIYVVTIPDLEDTVERQASAKEDIRRDDEEPKNPDVEIAATKPEQEPEPEAPKQVLQPVTLIVNLEDYETGEPLEASVRLRRASDNVVVGIKKLATGIYQMQVTEEKETEYMLSAEKNGYMFKNFKMKLPAAQANPLEIKRNIEMERLTTGYQSVLRNIYFDFDKATFKVNSYDELNKLEQLMAVNEKTQIEISGHTDNIGKKNYNLWLSRKRANAVVEYLVNKGIDERRLIVKGYGDTKPLASNDNEIDGRALNRRVEFKIIGDFNPAMGKSDE